MSRKKETRRCPRCGGNFFLDKDYEGWYLECLQCSYTRSLYVPTESESGRM